jgi:hypothetical protein
MNYGFLHVGFHNFVVTPEMIKSLEVVFNNAPDWFRYSSSQWLLWTNESADEWGRKLNTVPGLPDNYGALIIAFDPRVQARGGKTYKVVWDWLNKPR